MKPPAAPESALRAQLGKRETAGTILVVDDEVFIRSAFQLYLETVGYKVKVAESGERAVEIFSDAEARLDVAILDLVMPGIQGLEVLKIFKGQKPEVEVIIATGCGSMKSAIEALRYGAFDYITKPIVNFDQDLLKVVQEAMRSRQDKLRRQAREAAGGLVGVEKRLTVLEQLVEIAIAINAHRQGEPTLEKIESLLLKHFAVGGGVVFSRAAAGEPAAVYSWGLSGALSPPTGAWPDSGLFNSLRKGSLGLFRREDLAPEELSLLPGEPAWWRALAALPLHLPGHVGGSLLLLFADELPSHLSVNPERNAFQVLAPLLAAVFSEPLRSARG